MMSSKEAEMLHYIMLSLRVTAPCVFYKFITCLEGTAGT